MNQVLMVGLVALAMIPSSLAAACVNGATLLELYYCTEGSLKVSNGSNSWTLTQFGGGAVSATGYNSGVDGSGAIGFVSASWAPYTVGNQFGFSVTFTATGGAPADLFTVLSGQQVAFTTSFSAYADNAASYIDEYGVFITGWSPTDNTVGDVGPSVSVNKMLLYPGIIKYLQADNTQLFRDPEDIAGFLLPFLFAQDSYQLNAGENGSSAGIISYTNYFLPEATGTGSEVPEPTTFALLWAGLMGLVVAARRK
jgi:hypothetical protein